MAEAGFNMNYVSFHFDIHKKKDFRNSKVRKEDKFMTDWSQHKNTCKSQSGIGPGVRRSKRPLLPCRTRFKCSMEKLP